MMTKEIKKAAKENLKGRFGTTLLAEVVGSAIVSLSCFIPFGNILTAGPIGVGIANVYAKGSRHEEVSITDLFKGFMENFGENFLAGILKSVFLLCWSFLFIIPGIVKCYSYAMTDYILANDPAITAIDAITKSRQLMKGHKMELFLLDLSFIGWIWLTIITCGIAAFYTVPYMAAAKTEFFKRIYIG